MGRKRHRVSSAQKEIKKQKRKEKQEQKRLQKEARQKAQVEASPKLELNSFLTYGNYSVYYIVSNTLIGYLGVFSNGNFNYSIIEEDFDESQILIFIKDFIQEKLELIPVLNPKLYF